MQFDIFDIEKQMGKCRPGLNSWSIVNVKLCSIPGQVPWVP